MMKRTRSRAAKVDGGGLSPKKRLPAEAPNDSLKKDFFDVPCAKLAIDLLGKKLVRRMQDETRLEGVIVETEAYLGKEYCCIVFYKAISFIKVETTRRLIPTRTNEHHATRLCTWVREQSTCIIYTGRTRA